MKIKGSRVLVTGANRGLGLAFVRALLARGAARVYAGAREPSTIAIAGVQPVQLDVTRPEQIAAAAAALDDVSVVINNAGISRGGGLLAPDGVAALEAELATNLLGPLLVARAFAPVLARNGGGALVDVLSALSWINRPGVATYSVSKAAAWSLTNGLRQALAAQGTHVVAVHVGYMDTDMARHVSGPKTSPDDVAGQTLDAIEDGRFEVLADEVSRQIKGGLSAPQAAYLGVGQP